MSWKLETSDDSTCFVSTRIRSVCWLERQSYIELHGMQSFTIGDAVDIALQSFHTETTESEADAQEQEKHKQGHTMNGDRRIRATRQPEWRPQNS